MSTEEPAPPASPDDLPGPQIEDLVDLSVQIGLSGMCACGKAIVQLGTGAWRSDEHPWGDDRIACNTADDRRHHPQQQPDLGREIRFTTGDLP
jgi:hypothetical protein